MGATTPEEIDEVLAEAFRAKDLDAIGELYEEDALLAHASAGYSVTGRAAILEKYQQGFAADVEWVTDPPARTVVEGDLAVVHFTFRATVTLPDGTRQERDGRSTTVLRRGDDGNWRLVIDHS